MRKFYSITFILMLGIAYQANAQTSFSFSCPKDTLVTGCTASCITLKTKIPDIRASTNSYVINKVSGAGVVGCYAPYVDPGLPGTPTNLTIDDTYSSVINLPFTFPFFGTPYTSLVASTNGYISFDITTAGDFSHYSTAAGDLPNTGYDRALIMGPYHDLDPAYTTSPTQRIKYEVLGAAPHRKWILSFYKVPLFLTSCQNLIQNTHQIVIYEGIGVVEVFITDKQICTGWNNGKSMVGMQNYNRDAGIMAPGRKVSDVPWGSIGMNEMWRFTPATGPTLYRKVELFDMAGNLVSTGDTTSIGNNIFEVAFPNVCTNATTSFVVKSTYQDINNPSGFIYGTDTVRIVRANAMTFNATTTDVLCNGANSGTFTATAINGTGPYQYSIDGGITYQPDPTFSNLSGNTYTLTTQDLGTGCVRDTVIIINEPTVLAGSAISANATCSPTPDGVITVTANGGVPGSGYQYSIDGGVTYQPSNIFNVITGSYTVTIKDANGCTKTSPVTVDLTNTLTVSTRTDTTICNGSSVVLTTNTNYSGVSYSWTPSASLNDASLANPSASPSSNTNYIVTATLGQCTRQDDVDIAVRQDVQVDAGQPVILIAGDQAQLFGTATNATSYLWTPVTGLSSVTVLNPIVKPTSTTLYTLTVKNDVGCSASDDVLVTVIPYCIKVRNAFTPNGDGINDIWSVYDQYDCLKNITVHVFNRYGNEVYFSKDYRNTWDGRYKGKSLPDGTYFAVIDFLLVDGKLYTAKSDLTILR